MREIQVAPGESDVLTAREGRDSGSGVVVNSMNFRVRQTSFAVQVLAITNYVILKPSRTLWGSWA